MIDWFATRRLVDNSSGGRNEDVANRNETYLKVYMSKREPSAFNLKRDHSSYAFLSLDDACCCEISAGKQAFAFKNEEIFMDVDESRCLESFGCKCCEIQMPRSDVSKACQDLSVLFLTQWRIEYRWKCCVLELRIIIFINKNVMFACT